MLIESKYNYKYYSDNKTILYNALSQKILILDKEYDINNWNNAVLSSETRRFLVDNHFWVEPEYDENALMDMYRMESIMQDELQLMILPTTICNFKCIYCYENLYPSNMDEITMNNIICFIKREMGDKKRLVVEWFGGEPLVQKEIIYRLSEKILEVCHLSRKQFVASITTNGSLLDVETFQRLLNYHVFTFNVTLDGPAYIHNKLKPYSNGRDSFDTIIGNLLDIKKKFFSKRFAILVRVNVTRVLLPVFEEFLKYLYELFGNDPHFSFMFRIVQDCESDTMGQIRDQLLDSLDEVYDLLLKSKVNLDYRGHYELLSNRTCFGARRNAFVIYVDSSVYKCPNLIGDEKSRIGYLDNSGQILLNKKMLSKWINANLFKSSRKCEVCSFAPSCKDCPTKVEVMNGERPCILLNGRLNKMLELFARGQERYSYNFVYKIVEGEIVQ